MMCSGRIRFLANRRLACMALVALGAFMGLAVDGAILVVVAFWVLTSLEVQISCSLLAFLTSSFRFYLAVMP